MNAYVAAAFYQEKAGDSHLQWPGDTRWPAVLCSCTVSQDAMPTQAFYGTGKTSVYDQEGRKEVFYLTTHSTHFIYGYMVSDIWLRTILIVRKETRCRHIGYPFRLVARVLLYAPSLSYTSRGALAGMRNSLMGPPHEGSIRRPIAPWANALTRELHLAPVWPGDEEPCSTTTNLRVWR